MTPRERAELIYNATDQECDHNRMTVEQIEAEIEAAVADARREQRERDAKLCDSIYISWGESARQTMSHEDHERCKNRAGGAGECAAAIRKEQT